MEQYLASDNTTYETFIFQTARSIWIFLLHRTYQDKEEFSQVFL